MQALVGRWTHLSRHTDTISVTYALGIDPLSWGKPSIEDMRWCQLAVRHMEERDGVQWKIGEDCFQVLCAVPLFLVAGEPLRWRLITGQTGCHPATDTRKQASGAAQPALVCSATMVWPESKKLSLLWRVCVPGRQAGGGQFLDQPIPWSGAGSCPTGKEGQQCVISCHPMGIHPTRDLAPRDHCFPWRSNDSSTLIVRLSLEAHPDLDQGGISVQHPRRVSP